MLKKEYLSTAEITKDDDGNIDYKMLCDLHPVFRSEIMNMSDKHIIKRLNVLESYAKSLQHTKTIFRNLYESSTHLARIC